MILFLEMADVETVDQGSNLDSRMDPLHKKMVAIFSFALVSMVQIAECIRKLQRKQTKIIIIN